MSLQINKNIRFRYGSKLPKNYERDFEKFIKLSRKVNKKLADGSFNFLPFFERCKQIRKIKKLYNHLVGQVSDKRLKVILAAVSIFVISTSCNLFQKEKEENGIEEVQNTAPSVKIIEGDVVLNNGEAKTFTTEVIDPDEDDEHTFKWFVDDEEQSGSTESTFVFSRSPSTQTDYVIKVQVSDGTDEATSQVTATVKGLVAWFASSQTNPFGLLEQNEVFFDEVLWPEFADIDNNGDFDLFIGSDDCCAASDPNTWGNICYYENTGSSTSPVFDNPQIDPFGLSDYYSSPSLVDIDEDGDLDYFAGADGGKIYYFENTGDAASPSFAATQSNSFGLTSIPGDYFSPAFIDIDSDGDFDAFVTSSWYSGDVYYFENTGSSSSPAFDQPVKNPFNFSPPDHALDSLAFADIDSDGDLDGFACLFSYYSNTGKIYYYENAGSKTSLSFSQHKENPFNLSLSASMVCPDLVYIDSDGDSDLFVGGMYYENNIYYFENVVN